VWRGGGGLGLWLRLGLRGGERGGGGWDRWCLDLSCFELF